MPRHVTVATTQMACVTDPESNFENLEALIRDAAAAGADVVVLQELPLLPYFCKDTKSVLFGLATPIEGNRFIERFSKIAAELRVVIPFSFFERANNAYYSSVVMIDADGTLLGVYRKSHLPNGPGRQEKYYFAPGDSGLRVFPTLHGRIGIALGWDAWFPEAARVLALQGAELIVFPSAMGGEPRDTGRDMKAHWQRVVQGHAGANFMPCIVSNRVGTEQGTCGPVTFYGGSFLTGPEGDILAEADRTERSVLTAVYDLDKLAVERANWGAFRDRRPDLYSSVLTLDGGRD
eukprot:CAMPEP_0114554302 /NCGR_PEP_ID=MMETSP0114-20121206/8140_1 /TAXON_ID=31324 /ORGANISM="Goniomonas sp, Strain m" /LENGTH=291 /DNA_ID=CAMNT_0001739345 /DNA_START=42 /DNA_END=917 /DNA_ORIENTATION=-